MSEVTGKALDWKLLGRVMHYVRPYRSTFVIAAFLTVFLAGNALVQPVLMQLTLDKAHPHYSFEQNVLRVPTSGKRCNRSPGV